MEVRAEELADASSRTEGRLPEECSPPGMGGMVGRGIIGGGPGSGKNTSELRRPVSENRFPLVVCRACNEELVGAKLWAAVAIGMRVAASRRSPGFTCRSWAASGASGNPRVGGSFQACVRGLCEPVDDPGEWSWMSSEPVDKPLWSRNLRSSGLPIEFLDCIVASQIETLQQPCDNDDDDEDLQHVGTSLQSGQASRDTMTRVRYISPSRRYSYAQTSSNLG
jgi:hypothetical protein